MNKENLLKMADYIEIIPQELFSMDHYRDIEDMESHKCNSIGCVIGHCTILDSIENIPKFKSVINFNNWSYRFTGLNPSSLQWEFCFSPLWSDHDNTPEGAAERIRHLVNKGHISESDLTLFNAPHFNIEY